uniref:Uncharacterized protein n=1 Tax=Timema tahoe TaxID=61484 RepID=A0A7R9IM76_9NEOP|nr:unnamed protein product [Timema tahoe]
MKIFTPKENFDKLHYVITRSVIGENTKSKQDSARNIIVLWNKEGKGGGKQYNKREKERERGRKCNVTGLATNIQDHGTIFYEFLSRVCADHITYSYSSRSFSELGLTAGLGHSRWAMPYPPDPPIHRGEQDIGTGDHSVLTTLSPVIGDGLSQDMQGDSSWTLRGPQQSNPEDRNRETGARQHEAAEEKPRREPCPMNKLHLLETIEVVMQVVQVINVYVIIESIVDQAKMQPMNSLMLKLHSLQVFSLLALFSRAVKQVKEFYIMDDIRFLAGHAKLRVGEGDPTRAGKKLTETYCVRLARLVVVKERQDSQCVEWRRVDVDERCASEGREKGLCLCNMCVSHIMSNQQVCDY